MSAVLGAPQEFQPESLTLCSQQPCEGVLCRVHSGVRVKGLSAAKDDQVCSLPSLAPVYVVVLVY